MNVVNLKRDGDDTPCACPAEYYPWGLCLRLGKEELEKLGIDKMPGIGDTVQIAGLAKVIELRDDGDMRSMELQVTDLGVQQRSASAAVKMYPTAATGEDED